MGSKLSSPNLIIYCDWPTLKAVLVINIRICKGSAFFGPLDPDLDLQFYGSGSFNY